MVVFVSGYGQLLAEITRLLPPDTGRPPVGTDPGEQARWLAHHPVPPGRHGAMLTDQPALWQPAQQAGWRVYWCSPDQPPMGTEPLPGKALAMTLGAFIRLFWNVDIADTRIVADVMTGHARRSGSILFVTSCTGGVGKSVTSRRLAERASRETPTLLVDGNMLQSSQRSFFDPARTRTLRTIYEWRGGNPTRGANQGKTLHVPYDVCFAPPPGMTVAWDEYVEYVRAARRAWGFIIVDLDRVSAVDFTRPGTAAHDFLLPLAHEGAHVLFIVKAGVQTQGDAVGLLSALPQTGIDPQQVGVKDTIPEGMRQADWKRIDWTRWATWLGVEFQSREAGMRIAAGESGWSDPGLDRTREKVLEWALPGMGFDPGRVKEKAKGWKL